MEFVGVPGRIRTRDPLLRRQPLCPTELQGHALDVCSSLATAKWTVKKCVGRGEIGEPMPHVSVVRIQTTETGRFRNWRVAPISRSSTSGRVVKCRWTNLPTGRLKVLEATRAAMAPRAPAQNPRFPPEAISAASPPIRAPTTRLVPQNGETARSECPNFISRRASWAASETISGDAVDQITKPDATEYPPIGGLTPRSKRRATVACSRP